MSSVKEMMQCCQSAAFQRPQQGAEQRIRWVVMLTVVMMVVEILAGWLFHSMALLADGWHMSTHALALGISLLAYALSRRLAGDHRLAFGTWKIEVLGAYTSALILAVVAFSMIAESISRLSNPGDINYLESMMVAVVGLAVNLFSAWLLGDDHHHGIGHGHAHGHHADDHDHDHHGHHDLNKKAAYLHVLTDAATSVLAIVALLGGLWWGAAWLDPLMGIIGGVVILVWAWGLVKESSLILIDADTETSMRAEILQTAEQHALQIDDLHVWRIGDQRYAAIIGLAATSESSIMVLRQALQRHHQLVHLTIDQI
jgi:cation diffusion facilitator family transporter